jgi:hypothetical protein
VAFFTSKLVASQMGTKYLGSKTIGSFALCPILWIKWVSNVFLKNIKISGEKKKLLLNLTIIKIYVMK